MLLVPFHTGRRYSSPPPYSGFSTEGNIEKPLAGCHLPVWPVAWGDRDNLLPELVTVRPWKGKCP